VDGTWAATDEPDEEDGAGLTAPEALTGAGGVVTGAGGAVTGAGDAVTGAGGAVTGAGALGSAVTRPEGGTAGSEIGSGVKA